MHPHGFIPWSNKEPAKKQTPVNHHLTGKGRWRLDGLNVKSICDEHAASVVALGIATLACSQVQTTTTACIDSKKPTSLLVNRIA